MPYTQKIYLSDTDRKIAGVCGGLAERFMLDSTVIRLGVVFTALVTAVFPVLFTYIVAAIIIPSKPKAAAPLRTAWSPSGEGREDLDKDQ